MEYKLTLCLAERSINSFMRIMSLRPDFKWYIKKYNVTIDKNEHKIMEIDRYIEGLIRTSQVYYSQERIDIWVPVILYNGIFYYKKYNVKVISDEDNECFMEEGLNFKPV